MGFLRFFASSHGLINRENWQSRIFEKKSGGRDFGPNGVKKGLFSNFLEKLTLDFVVAWSAKGPYGPSNVCQVSIPGKIWFSRYGAICDPEKAPKRLFRLFLENFSLDFANFLPEWGSYCTRRVCKVWSPAKIWFSRYGAKRGQKGVKMELFGIFSKILHLFF